MTARTRKKEWKPLFIEELTKRGNVSDSCTAAMIARQTAYEHRKKDKDFAQAWEDALGVACDSMEKEALRRATEGTSKPVFYQGEIVGHIQEYSDTLLIFLLKANRPYKYREHSKIEHSGSIGVKQYVTFSPDDWDSKEKK